MSVNTQGDPFTTSRRDFTANLLNAPTPPSACSDWATVQDGLKALLRLLINHPAMARNIDQTFMTPAASKNKVYFMWDFVGRTLGMLYQIDPAEPRGEEWKDVVGRCQYAGFLIGNDRILNEMMDMGGPTEEAEFGEEVVAASKGIAEDVAVGIE